ncbi:MAG TPA: hypothetical protein VHA77_01320 [Xanthobacteraceae bacterium]|jgi:hypothetical protein|nr:hypothetical protein [Xanthobacteraceae bacterium]
MDTARSGPRPEAHEHFDRWSLVRLGAWGMCAVLALAAAVAASRSDAGLYRLGAVLGRAHVAATGSTEAGAVAHGPAVENELQRLAATVRRLSEDRDRLARRLEALERNFDDRTGSIGVRGSVSANPLRAPLIPLEETNGGAGPIPAGGMSPDAAAPADADQVTRTEFGVDLGGSSSLEGVRTLWISVKGNRSSLFTGLRPVIAVREDRSGRLDLRLIAGPMSNAGTAARLCAVLGEAGLFCQPTVFDGQRLAVR